MATIVNAPFIEESKYIYNQLGTSWSVCKKAILTLPDSGIFGKSIGTYAHRAWEADTSIRTIRETCQSMYLDKVAENPNYPDKADRVATPKQLEEVKIKPKPKAESNINEQLTLF